MPVMQAPPSAITGQPMEVSPGDVMMSPMMAAGSSNVASLSPEALKALKDEMYKRYIAKMFAQAPGMDPTPAATTARTLGGVGKKLSGILPFSLFGGPEDVELPNESGIRDPRLGPGSAWDQLKLTRDTLKRLTK